MGGGARRVPGPSGRGLLRLAAACAARPRVALAVLGAATLASLGAAAQLELRTDGAALHPLGHPVVERSRVDAIRFGDTEEVLVLASPAAGAPGLTSRRGLVALVDLHRGLASLPVVEASKLLSAASLVDVPTSTFVEPGRFLRGVPEDPDLLAARLERLQRRPSTAGLLLEPSGRAAVLHVSLVAGAHRSEAIGELQDWLEARTDPLLRASLLGPAVAETVLGERILEDLARLVPVMCIAMGLLLLACLRSTGGLAIAGAKMAVVLVWTLGLMAVTGTPVTLVTTILPVLLLAMAVTDEAHVLACLQPRLGESLEEERRAERVLEVLRELERPLVLTSASTAIGLLSFLAVPIAPVRQFGLFAAVGLLLALLLTFTLTTALAVSLPLRWFRRLGAPVEGTPLLGFERLLLRRRTAALAAGFVLVLAATPLLRGLRVQDSWITNFDPQSELVRADRTLNERFWGSYRCDVVFTGAPGAFFSPHGLQFLARARELASRAVPGGGVVGPTENLETVARVLGLTGPLGELSEEALEAVARLSFLRDGGLQSRTLTEAGDAARLLVVLNDADYEKSRALEARLREEMSGQAEPAGFETGVSGSLPLANATVEATVSGQLRSIATTLGGIALMLLVTTRRPGRTLVQLLPASAAVLLVLAGMGAAGMPLGIATSLFAAMTIGVGVDLALHLTSAFDRSVERGDPAGEALMKAAAETAQGRRWSTLVLGLGFLVLTVSAFAPNRGLGLLLGAGMLLSYLATYLFIPRCLAR